MVKHISKYRFFLFTMTLSLWYGFTHAQNLIAYYPLNGDAIDKSGNNNHGKLLGGTTIAKDRFGNPCGALSFNGKDGYIEIPTTFSLESISNYLSVSCWFYIPKTTQNSVLRDLTLICKGDQSSETSSNPQYRVQILQMATQSTVSINTEVTKNDLGYRNHLVAFDSWNFYCLTYDGIRLRTYLNGILTWDYPVNTAFERNKASLYIGKDIPGGLEFFRGKLDDLKIYNGVLSRREILDLYNDRSEADYFQEFSLKCPPNISVFTPKNSCSETVNFDLPEVKTFCGTSVLKQITGLASGSRFPLGSSTVAFLAEGQYFSKSACDFSITVKDNIPPIIQCDRDTTIIVESTDTLGLNFIYSLPKAKDNCSIAEVKLIEGQSSNSLFKLGTTTLKFQAIDNSGNKSMCSYSVNIIRGSLPKLSNDVDDVLDEVPILQSLPKQSSLIMTDSVYFEHELKIRSCIVTAVMFDDGDEDNDTISLYYNGKTIVDYQMIRQKQNEQIIKVLVLNPDEINTLVSKAWNTGKVSPNTLKIEFYEGNLIRDRKIIKGKKPIATKIVHSKPGLAAAIKITCEL